MELGRKKIRQHLGSFLKMQSYSNLEIYYKTGIDPTRISKLSNPDKDTITAEEFFLIGLAVESDLDEMAAHVFGEYKLLDYHVDLQKTDLTKFGEFLNDGLILQKTVSLITNISKSKLSNLSNDNKSVPLAKEVYLTALALNKKSSDAFKLICGHRSLNNAELQEHLRIKYKGTR